MEQGKAMILLESVRTQQQNLQILSFYLLQPGARVISSKFKKHPWRFVTKPDNNRTQVRKAFGLFWVRKRPFTFVYAFAYPKRHVEEKQVRSFPEGTGSQLFHYILEGISVLHMKYWPSFYLKLKCITFWLHRLLCTKPAKNDTSVQTHQPKCKLHPQCIFIQ